MKWPPHFRFGRLAALIIPAYLSLGCMMQQEPPVYASQGGALSNPMVRACAAPDVGFQLPYRGPGRYVIQGNDGAFSHSGRYRFAWDFRMPEGTEVTAAADGIVVEVIDWHNEGGRAPHFAEKANFIFVDHGDSRFSVYQHLRLRGSLVRPGQSVQRGQVIGYSGNTGFSTEPHLHFAVIDYRNRTLPICFVDVRGGVPVAGYVYGSGNHGPSGRVLAQTSVLPANAFQENQIELSSAVPARRIDRPFVVSGRVLRPASQVAVIFRDRERRLGTKDFRAPVGPDGSFQVYVQPAETARLGAAIEFTVVPVDGGRIAPYEFTVPVFVDRAPHSM